MESATEIVQDTSSGIELPISARAMQVLSRAAKRNVLKQQKIMIESNPKYRRYLKSSGDGVGRRKKPTFNVIARAAVYSAPPAMEHFEIRNTSAFKRTPRIVVISASQDSTTSTDRVTLNNKKENTPKSNFSHDQTLPNTARTADFSDVEEEELSKPELYENQPTKPTETPRSPVSAMNWAWVHGRLASRETNFTRAESSMTFRDFLDALDPNSDEYDTDLEDDFFNYRPETADPTGVSRYKKICCRRCIPTSQKIVKKLSDENSKFSLNHRSLSSKDTMALSAALLHNSYVQQLDLSANSIDDTGAKHIMDMLKKNSNIERLNLGWNRLNKDSGGHISSMLCSNTTLTHVSITHNNLCDNEALQLCEALKSNSSLQSLDVSHNQFSEGAGQAFAAMLMDNTSLNSMNMAWNMLGRDAAAAIGKSLKVNTSLQSLDLSWNGLGDEGAALLGRPLRHNSSLRHLSLAVNHIGPFGAERLVSGITGMKGKKTKKSLCGLNTLILDRNPLGRKGLLVLIKHLQQSEVLCDVSIKEVVISADILTMLRQLVISRPSCVFYEGQSEHEKAACALYGGSVQLHRALRRSKMQSASFLNSITSDGKIKSEKFRSSLENLKKCSNELEIERMLQNLDQDQDGIILRNDIAAVVYKPPPVKTLTRRKFSRVKV